MYKIAIFIGLFCLWGCGANSTVYPGTGMTANLDDSSVEVLGQTTSCQGIYCKDDETRKLEWPVDLRTPPPADVYQALIRQKAARIYKVPESQIVVGDIHVTYTTELVGIIHGWTASAIVGKRRTTNTERTMRNQDR